MCQTCEKTIADVWRKLDVGQRYRTPDLHRGVDFKIETKSHDSIKIAPQGVVIKKNAFIFAIHYLRSHGHDMNLPCEIRSSTGRNTAGPLCIAARDQNSNVRCINYILPILQRNAVVGVNPVQPNTTRLLAW